MRIEHPISSHHISYMNYTYTYNFIIIYKDYQSGAGDSSWFTMSIYSLILGRLPIESRNGSYQFWKHVIPRQGIRAPLLCSKSFRPSISVLSHAPLFVVGDAAWLHDSFPRHELLTVWPLEMICSHIRAMIRTQMPIINIFQHLLFTAMTSSGSGICRTNGTNGPRSERWIEHRGFVDQIGRSFLSITSGALARAEPGLEWWRLAHNMVRQYIVELCRTMHNIYNNIIYI